MTRIRHPSLMIMVRQVSWRVDDQGPPCCRWTRPSAIGGADRRTSSRHQLPGACAGRDRSPGQERLLKARSRPDPRGQGLQFTSQPKASAWTRYQGNDPRTQRSVAAQEKTRTTRWPTLRIRPRRLPRPERSRKMLQPPQTMARNRHPLRQTRAQLPRRHRPSRHPPMDNSMIHQTRPSLEISFGRG